MGVGNVVDVLVEYYGDGEDAFGRRYGSGAVMVTRDMADLLRRELGGQLDFDSLWAEFVEAPRATRPQITGVLEAMVEADPGLAEKLQQLAHSYNTVVTSADRATEGESPEGEAPQVAPPEDLPVLEREGAPVGHEDDAGEGAYLYGNVRAGSGVSVGKVYEFAVDVPEIGEDAPLADVDVSELFDGLQVRIERAESLAEQRRALREELDALQAELVLGDEADETRIVKHLRRLGEIDVEILELVLTGLWHTHGSTRALVEQAVGDLRRGEQGDIAP